MFIEKVALSREMFDEAHETGRSFKEILEREAKKQGKFSEDLAAKGMDAFAQQLAARDLRISGAHASLVEDFFKTDDSKLLFVETINEFVRIGMQEQLESFASLQDIVATRTGIVGSVYQGAEVDLDTSKATALRVGERGSFPKVTINFKDKTITLYKIGYQIEGTYEAIRRMRTNVFGTAMKVIGRNLTQSKLAVAIDVLINGDGNGNPIQSINAITPGTLSYADIVLLEESFEDFAPNVLISDTNMRVAYRNLPEYKDSNGPSMMDAPKKCKAVPSGCIIALDNRAALEEVYEKGASLVEYDKIITMQIENAVISEVSGFAKLFNNASKMLVV